VPARLIKRVEIIRGPGSALYGSNAFLGVVNIITDETNEVIVQGGTNAAKRPSLNLAHEAGPIHVALFADFHRTQGGDYKLPDAEMTSDAERGHNIHAQLMYQKLTVNGFYYFNRHEDFFQFSSINSDQNYNETSKWAIDTNYEWYKSEGLTVELPEQGSQPGS
jgi:outer membrane cobalamin receptor